MAESGITRRLKLYLETSVWNFYYADDAPYEKEITRTFFENLVHNEFDIYISDVVIQEIREAAEPKQTLLIELIQTYPPIMVAPHPVVDRLASEYIQRQALPPKAKRDGEHIAFATVYEFDFVVSWNMRHIANVRRQERVQAVNLFNGYTKPIQLITPMVVSNYESTQD